MKTKLIIVRHAEAVGNVIREFHGWTDSEITEKGHKQAQLVAERLKEQPIDVIYSSSLKRTRQTGEYISKVKGLPIIFRDDLKEINGGLWEGMPWSELSKAFPKEYVIWEEQPHIHQMPEGGKHERFAAKGYSSYYGYYRYKYGKEHMRCNTWDSYPLPVMLVYGF